MDLYQLTELRKSLHKYPEVSGNELETSNRVLNFISRFNPDSILKNVGGNGLCFIFGNAKNGPVTVFRSDMDALPIKEINDFPHRSVYEGVSHKCGHDGHMTIMAGLAAEIAKNPPKKGKAVLLFQPSEETGQGAKAVVEDTQFKIISPDFVFGLHNIPGYEKNQVIVRDTVFASASVGLKVQLFGKTSHAGEPQKGINPAKATAEIINRFLQLPKTNAYQDALLTIVHVNLGEIAYGTSAGYAEIRATLRSHFNSDLDNLVKDAKTVVAEESDKELLRHQCTLEEAFFAVENKTELVNMIRNAAQKENLKIIELAEPFRWSEDFSYYSMNFPSAFFGLGAGKETPKLHNPDYDFPDDILSAGIQMFFNIYSQIHLT